MNNDKREIRMNKSACEMSWSELSEEIQSYVSYLHYKDIQKIVLENPLTAQSIEHLVSHGWHVKPIFHFGVIFGQCRVEKKEISINANLSPYDRDKTLFHELVHAWYGKILDDGWNAQTGFKRLNGIITEHLGREYRTSHFLLRTALTTFGLPIHVYDKASYLAKYPEEERTLIAVQKNNQLVLPFGESHIDCMRTWID